MKGYGEYCSVARSHEVLGGRWTLLVVRELLCGSTRFNDIRRGIARISRTMLSERLQALVQLQIVNRIDGAHGPEYVLTEAGRELSNLVGALGTWGQRWLPRHASAEDSDWEPLLIDMERRVRFHALPKNPLVVRFEMERRRLRFMLLKTTEASFCSKNPGFPEVIRIRAKLPAMVAWWRGDVSFLEAQRMGLAIEGPKALVRAFPGWFDRYMFADVEPASRARGRVAQ